MNNLQIGREVIAAAENHISVALSAPSPGQAASRILAIYQELSAPEDRAGLVTALATRLSIADVCQGLNGKRRETGLIQQELSLVAEALREPRSAEEHSQLYAAQAALAWAQDPSHFQSPYTMIMGKAGGSEDYLARLCPPQSLCTDSHEDSRR